MSRLNKAVATLLICAFSFFTTPFMLDSTIVVHADNSTITRADIDKACEKFGIKTGKYWTYNYKSISDDKNLLDEAAKKGFKASDTPYGSLYASSYKGNVHKGEYYYHGYRQCWGFAELLGRTITEGKSPTNKWRKLNSLEEVAQEGGLQVGDVIQSSTHTAMVVEVKDGEFKVIQCLGSAENKITIDGFSTGGKKYTTLESIPKLKYVARYSNPLPHIPTVTCISASAGSKSDIKTSVLTKSKITLNWDASNAATYRLHITKDGTEYINSSLGNNTSWTGNFDKSGNYECTVIPYGDDNTEGRSAKIKLVAVPLYIAPKIDNLRITYSGYKYIEVQGTITDPGQGNAAYEIGTWEGNAKSPKFHSYGHAEVEGETIKGIIPVVEKDTLLSKFFGKKLTIGVNGIDSLNYVHYNLYEKIEYEYKFPVPSESKTIGSHTYYRFDQGYTWEDANNWAKNETNGHLVSIGSNSENETVASLIPAGSETAYYIGGFIDDSTGKWIWSDGSSFSYTNWIGGKPDKVKGIKTVIAMKSDGWKNYTPDFKSTFGFIIEIENDAKPLPTAYPTPSPTPKPTATPTPTPSPKPKPKLDKKQARSVVADAVALSHSGMRYKFAHRYDVNRDGIADLIIEDNKSGLDCIAYSDSKYVRTHTVLMLNMGTDYYYSKKSKKLYVKFARSSTTYSYEMYYSFSKDKLNKYSDASWNVDKRFVFEPDSYIVSGKKLTKSKYKKKIKSLKLKGLKNLKKSDVTKKQTKIPSVLLSDAAEYIKKDIFGNKVDIKYKDINKDGIKDCYFVISGSKVRKGYKGIKHKGEYVDEVHWADVGVVLESSSKGVVAKYYTAKEAKKLFK